MAIHKTVLKKETIDLLEVKDGNAYVDATLGGGGHSLELLEKLENGILVCIDSDLESILSFKKLMELKNAKLLSEYHLELGSNQIFLVNENFSNISNILEKLKIKNINGIIADLGWSSDQLNNLPGLSFQNPDMDLDMRFSKDLALKASDMLNVLSPRELKIMLDKYAGIKTFTANRIVEKIVNFRKKRAFVKVSDLTNELLKLHDLEGPRSSTKEIFTRVFQALRIAVNLEYQNLENLIRKGFELLSKDGKIAIITFHSGEEQIVKKEFGELTKDKKSEFLTSNGIKPYLSPSVNELKTNTRSRSAKLFGISKI